MVIVSTASCIVVIDSTPILWPTNWLSFNIHCFCVAFGGPFRKLRRHRSFLLLQPFSARFAPYSILPSLLILLSGLKPTFYPSQKKSLMTDCRVATVREKSGKNKNFSRSGKSQGILQKVRENLSSCQSQ